MMLKPLNDYLVDVCGVCGLGSRPAPPRMHVPSQRSRLALHDYRSAARAPCATLQQACGSLLHHCENRPQQWDIAGSHFIGACHEVEPACHRSRPFVPLIDHLEPRSLAATIDAKRVAGLTRATALSDSSSSVSTLRARSAPAEATDQPEKTGADSKSLSQIVQRSRELRDGSEHDQFKL